MKKTFVWGLAIIFAAGLLVAGGSAPAQAKTQFVTIGTGGVTGVYYPTGGAIAKIVNKKRKEYGIRATVESTGGSAFNVNALMSGDLEFGIVQSDRQYQAWNGLAEWKDAGPQKDLRAICSLHPETIILVAADNSGINKLADLKGKHVSIGNPGSGFRKNAIDALQAVGIDYEKDIQAENLKAGEQAKMLQDGRIDAFFYTVGNPNGSIKEATSGKLKVHFVPIEGPGIDAMIQKWPYYTKAVVPIRFYEMATNKEDVPTFAVKATLCTSAKVADDVVYAVTKEIFDNLDELKSLHEALSVLDKQDMLKALSAPIHPGAMKYYKEAGLMK